MKKSLLFLISLCGLCSLGGCGTTAPPPPATHFSVTSVAASPTAGTAFNVTVTALDSTNVVVPGYVGTVHFSSSDALAVLPTDSSLTSGTGTFSVTLKTAGNQTITATDTRALTGTYGPIAVKASTATLFTVAPATSTVSTGVAFNFTVTALDALNNTVTSYSGTVHFSSTDGSAMLPGNSTLTNGTGIFSAILKTSGNQTIMATDTVTASLTGTSFAIRASGPATHFSFSSVATVTTRKTVTIFVNALDASNNGSTGYNGTVHIMSSDGAAILPTSATLQTGSGNFPITLETPGNQTVTVTDIVTPSVTGTSSTIAVTAAPPLVNTSGAPPNGTVGSTYGPTFIQYLKCVRDILTGSYTCTPCVPNTSTCGGLPACPRRGVSPAVCVGSDTYVGFPLTATGGLPPYTWSASPLPAGLSLKFQTPETLVSGTPSPGAAGTYNVSVTVTDSGTPKVTTNPIIYAIVINNPPPPVVSTAPVFPGATVNQPFSYTFTATAGLPPYQNWTEKGALPPGIAPFTSAGVLSGTPTMTGSYPIMVTVDDSLGQMSAAQAINFQVYQHGFKPDGNMGAARTSHTATLLPDGTVLLAGGLGLGSAEKYDPGTGKFSPTTGNMSVARLGHTATLLKTGKVLITGGQASLGTAGYPTAELFDPGTGMFTLTTNNMSSARIGHNATLLADGKVLITGGFDGSNYLATAELFDPNTGTFALTTGAMGTARNDHTAALLSNGKVLVTGGFNGTGLASAELYDPTTESFSATGSMAAARSSHTATLLTTGPNSGKVLVAGGTRSTAVAELYDPTPGTFSTTGTMQTVATGTATLLSDGTVLMAGGQDPTTGTAVTLAELYDPNTGTFLGTGGLLTPRFAHTATLLKDGTVLVTGGVNGPILASAELYQ
jgi:hypothetical protein